MQRASVAALLRRGRRPVSSSSRRWSNASSNGAAAAAAAAAPVGGWHKPLHQRRAFSAGAAAAASPDQQDGVDAEAEQHRSRYREAMRKLGATVLPPPPARPPRPAGGSAGGSTSPAPPLSPEQVMVASKLPDGEAICQDPALASSLPALLFLADIFWTGLVVERPQPPPAKGGVQEEADASPGAASLIVAQDHAKAARLWQEASERFGDRGARYNYAQCLLHGHGVPENPQQAERLLTQLVEGKGKGEGDEEEGDPRACYSLAMLLSARLQQQQPPKGGGRGQQGRGDAGERVYALLRRAVQGGVLPAVHNLANLLAQGQGPLVPRDDTAAFALYEQGAALGDPWSTFTLGSWLCQGRGGEEEDWERGFELHLRAAEQFGMPQAAFNVGTHYFSGRGVEQDMGAAATWFERAAAAGMTQAMVNLGNMYLEGLVPPGAAADSDAGAGKAGEWSAGLEAARVWYGRAAEAGDAAGRECLAKCDALERERGEEEEGKGTK